MRVLLDARRRQQCPERGMGVFMQQETKAEKLLLPCELHP